MICRYRSWIALAHVPEGCFEGCRHLWSLLDAISLNMVTVSRLSPSIRVGVAGGLERKCLRRVTRA